MRGRMVTGCPSPLATPRTHVPRRGGGGPAGPARWPGATPGRCGPAGRRGRPAAAPVLRLAGGREELERDVVGSPERQAGAVVGVVYAAVGDARLVELLLPRLQLGPV